MTRRTGILIFFFFLASFTVNAQQLAVIGYYAGRSTGIDSFPTNKLTHIIFSFCHLSGNQLYVNNARDTATIQTACSFEREEPEVKSYFVPWRMGRLQDLSGRIFH